MPDASPSTLKLSCIISEFLWRFTANAERGIEGRRGEEGDQLPVNILLVSFQDIVAVVVLKKKKRSRRRDQSPRYRNACVQGAKESPNNQHVTPKIKPGEATEGHR